MFRKLPLALALAALTSGAALAAPEAPLASRTDLISVYQQAVNNNADLAAARAQFRATQEVVPQARAGLLPNLSAGAELSDTETDVDTSLGNRNLSRSGTTYQAVLSQPLFRADRWFQLQAAQALSEQAALQYSVACRTARMSSKPRPATTPRAPTG